MSDVAGALERLIDRWMNHYHPNSEHDNLVPLLPFDPSWQSICLNLDEQKEVDGEKMVQWQPVINQQPGDFSNIEQALDISLHPDIKSYYTHLVSADLDLQHEKGPLTLLQIFNEEDFATLQQNLIGHIMMKRQLKQRVTIFFAVTDEEDQMISMINDTGEIWLESVGKDPHLKLADDMAQFIEMLAP